MKLRLGILVPLGLALLVTPVASRAIKLFDLGDDDGAPTRVKMDMDVDALDDVGFWDATATSATSVPAAEVDLLKTHGPYDGFGGFNAQALQSGLALPMPRSVVRCPPGGCNETFWAERNNKRQTLPSPLPTTLPALSRDFQITCGTPSWTFTGNGATSKLTASCYNQQGKLVRSSVLIDNCLANNHGKMECYLPLNLFWATTCSNCAVSASWIMTCTCNNGDGIFRKTTTDVSKCFGNNNGQLYCNNHPP